MSELWPLDVRARLDAGPVDAIRSFRCVLLMPFEGRFDKIAEVIKSSVTNATGNSDFGFTDLPKIERLDWITSSNVIQQEIWKKILEADLVFCQDAPLIFRRLMFVR